MTIISTITSPSGASLPYSFGDIITEIFDRIREDLVDPDFWTIDEVKNKINDGYRRLCESSDIIIGTDRLTITKNIQQLVFPDNFVKLKMIQYEGIDISKQQIKANQLKLNVLGNSIKWAYWGLTSLMLEYSPNSELDGKNIDIAFRAYPPILEDETSEILINSYELLEGIYAYVLWKLYIKEGEGQEISKALRNRKLFRQTLDYAISIIDQQEEIIMGDY